MPRANDVLTKVINNEGAAVIKEDVLKLKKEHQEDRHDPRRIDSYANQRFGVRCGTA